VIELNDVQKQAVEHTDGPALVIAGAGSGKTRVVTQRIVRLIEKGVDASNILGVTFTNKAAGEMRERVATATARYVPISTFHSLGVKILREAIGHLGYKEDFTIYDEEDARKVIKESLYGLAVRESYAKPKVFKGLISQAKNALIAPEDIDTTDLSTPCERLFPAVYESYQKKLKEYNALDFDDLLYLVVRLFREHPEALEDFQRRWQYFLVDEYQDTNVAQYHMIKMLVSKTNNLFVVGDPDQSIYSWRGATIDNIMNFEKDYPGAAIISLEQNYRSTNTILEAANALIKNNDTRREKKLWSGLGDGEKIRFYNAYNDREEVKFVVKHALQHRSEGVSFKDMTIFYRTNFQSRIFEDALLREKIPYVIVGGISFYQRREIKDILAFLRIVYSSADFVSLARTINLPKRGFGDVTIAKIHLAADEAKKPVYEYCKAVVSGDASVPKTRITAKQKTGLADYIAIIEGLRKIKNTQPLSDLVAAAIKNTGYISVIKADRETFDDRKQNLEELITKAQEWEEYSEDGTLGLFLEELSLKASIDETNADTDRLNLMTIHNGKGLEFPVVFVVGLEEGLFPHANALGDISAVEEERRLCYVGITRARRFLYLTAAQNRNLWGSFRNMRQSRFLQELPPTTLVNAATMNKKSFDDATYEEDDDYREHERVSKSFSIGDAVEHKTFGSGIITASYYCSIGRMYEVFFDEEKRTRKIAAKYGKLARI
jgi:DNA helicase II / ATP-dependent DNA helicase PcrA